MHTVYRKERISWFSPVLNPPCNTLAVVAVSYQLSFTAGAEASGTIAAAAAAGVTIDRASSSWDDVMKSSTPLPIAPVDAIEIVDERPRILWPASLNPAEISCAYRSSTVCITPTTSPNDSLRYQLYSNRRKGEKRHFERSEFKVSFTRTVSTSLCTRSNAYKLVEAVRKLICW